MKTTVIIPTSVAPINCLLWTIFSILLRSKQLEIIVCINGPDKRTGNPEPQDKKQTFLEELQKFVPLNIIRVWSRIGHPESVEMALPWITTDTYLLTHDDDVIINKPGWEEKVEEKLNDPKVAIAFTPELLCCSCNDTVYEEKLSIRLPHTLCAFIICKKAILEENNCSWCGYHIKTEPFWVDENFQNYYKNLNLLPNPLNKKYEYLSMEMGAWHYYLLTQKSYQFAQLDKQMITHLGKMSWTIESDKQQKIINQQQIITELETEIKQSIYCQLFEKYKEI